MSALVAFLRLAKHTSYGAVIDAPGRFSRPISRYKEQKDVDKPGIAGWRPYLRAVGGEYTSSRILCLMFGSTQGEEMDLNGKPDRPGSAAKTVLKKV